MEKEELQKLFCSKIGLEIRRFKRKILKESPETIFERAYQIDCMVSIYELLLEMSQEIGEDVLKKLIIFPNLLAFLYSRWLKAPDSRTEELQGSLLAVISELEEIYAKAEKEEEDAA